MIEANSLVKNYGPVKVLKGLSFKIQKGEICGLLGPNGAGKSTTLKILTGYLKPDSGKAFLDQWEIQENSFEARSLIGYVPETPILYKEMLVQDYLEYVAVVKGVPSQLLKVRLDSVVGRCGLGNVLKKPIGSVSKGYRQRTALAQALIGNPSILFLDEPISASDPIQVLQVREVIRSLAKETTVLFCTHILQEVVSCCDRVLILNQGQLIAEKNLPMEIKDLETFFADVVRHA